MAERSKRRRKGAQPKPEPMALRLRRKLDVALRPAIQVTGVLLLGSAAWLGHLWWQQQEPVPFDKVLISGELQRVDSAALQELLAPMLEPGFFAADLQEIRSGLQSQSWIYRAAVTRVWPGELHVQLTEEVPIAVWGESGLLNHRGTLFARTTEAVPVELPRLRGPDGSQEQIMAVFRSVQRYLEAVGLTADGAEMDDLGYWTLRSGGTRLLLGAGDPLAQVQRFIGVYQQRLYGRLPEIERVDMRYSNGLAVAWRDNNGHKVTVKNNLESDTNG